MLDSLPIRSCKTRLNPDYSQLRHYFYRTRRTSTEMDQDYSIDHLERLLQSNDREISRCIWMTMTNAPVHVLKASYRPNQETSKNEAPSVLVHTLRRFPWVPSVEGGFHRPEDMATRVCRMTSHTTTGTIGWTR